MTQATKFDPIRFKETTRSQWQTAAEAWNDWGGCLSRWLGPATERMLDLAGVREGSHVLDVAAGAGEQTITTARRVGPGARPGDGPVLEHLGVRTPRCRSFEALTGGDADARR